MPIVQVTRGAHFRKEEGKLIRYGKGDRLEVTDRELEKFSDKFAVVDGKVKEAKPKKADKEGGGGDGAPVEFDIETADLDALKAKATELGIEVGPRWGERRLRDAITEVLEEGSED